MKTKKIVGLGVVAVIGFILGMIIFNGDRNLESEIKTLTTENEELMELNMASVERQNELQKLLREKEKEVVEEIEVVAIPQKTTYKNNVEAKRAWDLGASQSINVFRNLSKTGYMNELNATFVKAPQDADGGILKVTLGVEGSSQHTSPMHTWNITIGYSDCKINEILDRKSFPIVKEVDLSELDCTKGVVNMMDELKKGNRVAIYHAMDNGISYNGTIEFY